MFCPFCGNEQSEDIKFCGKCGKKIIIPKKTEKAENEVRPKIKSTFNKVIATNDDNNNSKEVLKNNTQESSNEMAERLVREVPNKKQRKLAPLGFTATVIVILLCVLIGVNHKDDKIQETDEESNVESESLEKFKEKVEEKLLEYATDEVYEPEKIVKDFYYINTSDYSNDSMEVHEQYLKGDESWFKSSGVLGFEMMDADADGIDELHVLIRYWEYDATHGQGILKFVWEIYEYQDDKVILIDSREIMQMPDYDSGTFTTLAFMKTGTNGEIYLFKQSGTRVMGTINDIFHIFSYNDKEICCDEEIFCIPDEQWKILKAVDTSEEKNILAPWAMWTTWSEQDTHIVVAENLESDQYIEELNNVFADYGISFGEQSTKLFESMITWNDIDDAIEMFVIEATMVESKNENCSEWHYLYESYFSNPTLKKIDQEEFETEEKTQVPVAEGMMRYYSQLYPYYFDYPKEWQNRIQIMENEDGLSIYTTKRYYEDAEGGVCIGNIEYRTDQEIEDYVKQYDYVPIVGDTYDNLVSGMFNDDNITEKYDIHIYGVPNSSFYGTNVYKDFVYGGFRIENYMAIVYEQYLNDNSEYIDLTILDEEDMKICINMIDFLENTVVFEEQ